MILKPITTEKAVKQIELDNTLLFATDRQYKKIEIKREVEKIFNVKVEKVRTYIKGNKKYAHVKLNKVNPAIDIATNLGMM
jgi:large subunit ribosomal protein L23